MESNKVLANGGDHCNGNKVIDAQKGDNKVEFGGITYGEYLKLDALLSSQTLLSEDHGPGAHDEHLFIITHQAYELWFKQILYELDSICDMLGEATVNESKTLRIISRLNRIVAIEKLLVDQMMILETMSPLDFNEFRSYLAPASGFQSFQFRLLENRMGLKQSDRVKYNRQHYLSVFSDNMKQILTESEERPSLLELIDRWLERTPGLKECEFDFWRKYERACERWLHEMCLGVDEVQEERERESRRDEYLIQKETFASLFDAGTHAALIARGERRLSHKATQGALMIHIYREEPRFHQPYQILRALKDIDSLFMKWRHNHVMLVQRMLGTKTGTGGSSGYQYLRSTVSDRYKVFLDLFNLSTFVLPKTHIPPLSHAMRRRLSIMEGDMRGLVPPSAAATTATTTRRYSQTHDTVHDRDDEHEHEHEHEQSGGEQG